MVIQSGSLLKQLTIKQTIVHLCSIAKQSLLTGILLQGGIIRAQQQYYGHQQLQPIHTKMQDTEMNAIFLPGNIEVQFSSPPVLTTYKLSDHLLSARAIVYNDLSVHKAYDYAPYGMSSGSQGNDAYIYTGTYTWNSGTRLYNSPGRIYDPASKRFNSRDPFKNAPSPYSYCINNPINVVDRNGAAPKYVDDYHSAAFASVLRHPGFPSTARLDPGSYRTLKLIEPRHAFTGVMNLKTGTIYLNPVVRRENVMTTWASKPFTKTARMKGQKTETIIHDVSNPGHLQLWHKVETDPARSQGDNDYIGFGIRFEEGGADISKGIYITNRSRSLNNPKFNNWIDGLHPDQAFLKARRRMTETFYEQLYQKLIYGHQEKGSSLSQASVLAEKEINRLYAASESDFPDFEAEAEYQEGMDVSFDSNGPLVHIQGPPEFHDVIAPFTSGTGLLPDHFGEQLEHVFQQLRGLPAPVQLLEDIY